MKSLFLCIVLILVLLGCGGSSSSNSTTSPANANLAGTWKVVLNENQAAMVVATEDLNSQIDSNNTEIELSLTQSGAFLSLASGTNIYSGNAGCAKGANWWWYSSGGWNFQTYSFRFTSGQVSATSVNLVFEEAMSETQETQEEGALTLEGTVNADGSISGTATDNCVLTSGGLPTTVTFLANKITTFPPSSWPNTRDNRSQAAASHSF